MTEPALKTARKAGGLTQQEVAARLGISQPYLALLESGRRPLTPSLARKAVRMLHASPSLLPCEEHPHKRRATTDSLAQQLSALGYPGYTYLRAGWVKNPAELLFSALQQEDLDPRVAEALPWVLLNYADLDHDWLLRQVRLFNLTNRLGFVVSLALRVEEQRGNHHSAAHQALAEFEHQLRQSRLEAECTFGGHHFSAAQQEWVRQNRPADAALWHVLTTWRPEHLSYAQ